MIDFYTWTTPNGRKISIMLEECGLEYTVHTVDINQGEQDTAEFRAVCPNGKIPAIVDRDGAEPVAVFESGAILIHLAERTGRFLPSEAGPRADVLQWLMWQMANVGPMFGQVNHFANQAPEQIPYAIERYLGESARLIRVMDDHLADRDYLAGEYSIA